MGRAMGEFLYYVFIVPILWVAGNIAGIFFPYEEDRGHKIVAGLISAVGFGALAYGLFLLFTLE